MKRKFPKADLPNDQADLRLDVLAFHDLVGMGLHFIVLPGDTENKTRIINLVFIREIVIDNEGKFSIQYQDSPNTWIDLSIEQSAALALRIMEIQASILRLTGKALPA